MATLQRLSSVLPLPPPPPQGAPRLCALLDVETEQEKRTDFYPPFPEYFSADQVKQYLGSLPIYFIPEDLVNNWPPSQMPIDQNPWLTLEPGLGAAVHSLHLAAARPPPPQIPLSPSQLESSISYPYFPPRGNSLRRTCQSCYAPLTSTALSNVLGNEPPPDLPRSIISRWLSHLHINNPLKGFFLPTPLNPLCTMFQESYNMFSATKWHH